jgi:alpha-N-arabinofuranosidase
MRRWPAAATVLCAPALVLTMCATAPSAVAEDDTTAQVHVGTQVLAEPVAEKILGVNHRWPDRGLGMWDAEADAPSPDIVNLSRRLGLRSIRYPGGTVANLFRWKRAIGPQEQRGCQVGGGFVGRQEPKDSVFGVDEQMEFAAAVGAETQIMTSSVQPVDDAADFVEYVNAPLGTNPRGGTSWAEVRAANGHPQPYGVNLWEIGNELYLGNQVYWRSEDLDTRRRQYAFGGTEPKTGEPVGTDCDHRDSASISTGAANQSFTVHGEPVVPESPTVYVDGTAWAEVHDLAAAGPDDAVYTFDPATGKITFGDGEHGRVPASGAQVTADYVSGPHPGLVDYYRAMKEVDPSISICVPWEDPAWVELAGTDVPYDCLAPHLYSHPDVSGTSAEVHDRWMGDAGHVIDELRDLEAALDATFGTGEDRPFLIASEWGAIPARGTGPAPKGWANSVTWALYASDLLGGMIEHGVRAADSSNLNGPRPTAGELFGGAPDFHWQARAGVTQLFGRLIGSTPVETTATDVPSASTGDYTALTAYSTRAQDGTVRVVVVNRDRERALPVRLHVDGEHGLADVTVLAHNGPSFASYNTPQDEDVVHTTTTSMVSPATSVGYTVEAHSTTLFEIRPRG